MQVMLTPENEKAVRERIAHTYRSVAGEVNAIIAGALNVPPRKPKKSK